MNSATEAAIWKRNDLASSFSDCPEPYSSVFCLNGATCFSVKINNSSLYNCWCRTGYHGLRCDYKYISKTQEVSMVASPSTSGQVNQVPQNNENKTVWSKASSLSVVPKRKPEPQFFAYHLAFFLLMIVFFVLFLRLLRKTKIWPLKCSAEVKQQEKKTQARAAQQVDYANINYDTTLELNDIVNKRHLDSYDDRSIHMSGSTQPFDANKYFNYQTGS